MLRAYLIDGGSEAQSHAPQKRTPPEAQHPYHAEILGEWAHSQSVESHTAYTYMWQEIMTMYFNGFKAQRFSLKVSVGIVSDTAVSVTQ